MYALCRRLRKRRRMSISQSGGKDASCPFCGHRLFHALSAYNDDRYCPFCQWAVDPGGIDWAVEHEFHAICQCEFCLSREPFRGPRYARPTRSGAGRLFMLAPYGEISSA